MIDRGYGMWDEKAQSVICGRILLYAYDGRFHLAVKAITHGDAQPTASVVLDKTPSREMFPTKHELANLLEKYVGYLREPEGECKCQIA